MRCAVLALVLATITLAGCDLSRPRAGFAPDTISLADRCATIMQAAMPFATIDVGDRGSKDLDIRTVVAQVSGRRSDQPDNAALDRDLAVECSFVDGVLTAFKWTKGGPAMH